MVVYGFVGSKIKKELLQKFANLSMRIQITTLWVSLFIIKIMAKKLQKKRFLLGISYFPSNPNNIYQDHSFLS